MLQKSFFINPPYEKTVDESMLILPNSSAGGGTNSPIPLSIGFCNYSQKKTFTNSIDKKSPKYYT